MTFNFILHMTRCVSRRQSKRWRKKNWIIIMITFYFIIAEILLLIRRKIEEVSFWMTHGRERR